MPDPQHHGTLLIYWTNYCAVLCLGVVVMYVLLLCFFLFYALPGSLLFQLGTPESGLHYLLYVVILFMMLSSSVRSQSAHENKTRPDSG